MRVNKLLILIPVFLLGGLATFSLEPYKLYPLIFCLLLQFMEFIKLET